MKELWTGQNEAAVQNSYQYVIRLKEKLESTMKLAQKELEKAQDRNKHHYDKKSKKKNIKVGDKVLVLLPTHRNKFMMEWKGPFLVVDEPYPNDFKILMNKKKRTYHVNLLKKYILRETETDPVIVSAVINHVDFTSEEDDSVELPTLSNQDSNAINESSTVSQIHLSTEKNNQLNQLIEEYKEIFSNQPGCAKIEQHRIVLTRDEPIASKLYKVPYQSLGKLTAELKEMEEQKNGELYERLLRLMHRL